MKCDRRWWNDGRLEREREAWSKRDHASPRDRAIVLRDMGLDPGDERYEVRRTGPHTWNVAIVQPRWRSIARVTL